MKNKSLFDVILRITHLGLLTAILSGAPTSLALAQWQQPGNTFKLGSKSNTNKDLIFDINNGAANPKFRANKSLNKLQFSNDGTNFKDIGSGSGGGSGINLLVDNPAFESGSNFWTNSGGTFVLETSAPLNGLASGKFTASGSGQYVESQAYAVPIILQGGSCLARVWYTGGDSNLKLQVRDGTGTLLVSDAGVNVEVTLQSNTKAGFAEVGFKCPSSGSIKLRIQSTAAAAAITFDDNHLGQEDRFFKSSQSNLVVDGFFAATGSCTWTGGSSTQAAFPTVPACPGPTFKINDLSCSTADTDLPKITCNVPEGRYKVSFSTAFAGNVTAQRWLYLTDGSTVCLNGGNDGANFTIANEMVCVFNYGVGQGGSKTFELQYRTSTGNAQLDNTIRRTEFRIEKFPSEASSLYYQSQIASDLSYVNEFTAQVSAAGVVSSESVDWINGNCGVASNVFTCTFNTNIFGVAPNCDAQSATTGGRWFDGVTANTTTLTYAGNQVSGALAQAGSIRCSRATNDYKIRSTVLGYVPQTKRVAYISDVRVSGTNGGTSSSTFASRNLNTLVDPSSIIQNPSSFTGTGGTNSGFQLSAGTYRIRATPVVYNNSGSDTLIHSRIQNTTDATTSLNGTSVRIANGNSSFGIVEGIFSITSQKSFSLESKVNNTTNNTGWGAPYSGGEVEVYSTIEIEKID